MSPPNAPVPLWKHAARAVARAVGVPVGIAWMSLLRLSGRRAGVALMYHAVEHRFGDPALELVPPHHADVFGRQIRHLHRHYRVVPAAELQQAARMRRRGERFPVAITFDDDLACHAEVALPILRSEGVTATFFLSGASLDRPFAFWYERLQRGFDERIPQIAAVALDDPAAAERGIHEVALAIEELDPGARDAAAARLEEALGPDPENAGIRADQVAELARNGMTIGFHTLRHDALSLLDDSRLERALVDGRRELADAAGTSVDVIGYPHGRANERVGAAARKAGFAVGFTTRGMPVTPDADALLLGRIGPSLRSVGALGLQIPLTLRRA